MTALPGRTKRMRIPGLLLTVFMGMVCGDATGLGQGFYLPALSLVEDNGYGRFSDIIMPFLRM